MELFLAAAISITLTWFVFKIVGVALFCLSLLVLFFGDLPDNEGANWANGLRWVV